MRKLWQKTIVLLIALLFLAGELVPSMTAHAYTSTSESNTGLELIASNETASLYLDRDGAMLRLVDNSTGISVDTKILDGDSGNTNIKANQKSDFIVSYWPNDRTQGTSNQVNFTMAIDKGQVEYTPVTNGMKIRYTLKEDKLSMDVVPKYISEERMNELVIQYLSREDREFLLQHYRLWNGYYTRTDGTPTQSTIRSIREVFYEIGQYTDDDLIADNEEWGYESEWSNLEIDVSLEYVLDGGDLVVRMPMEELTVNNEDVIINTVTLLPYFLSSTLEEEGYFIVPDGAGAAIDFNNTLTYAVDYSSRVYGKDTLIDTLNIETADYYATMPIIGAVYKNYAMLAIVESGQSMAEINAKISGKTDNYNNAYFRFYVAEQENVATTQGSSINVNRYTGDTFNGTIVVRYKLITDKEKLNYVGVAHTYQDYLIEQGVLKKQSFEPSLYLEMLGSSLEAKTFLGFPYRGVKSLTTFREAASILEDLSGRGVKNATVQLNGWLDGGERHEKLTSVKLESSQGSKSDFNNLLSTASSLGYSVYPDVALQEINPSFDFMQGSSAKSYAKKYGSRYLSNEYATLTENRPGIQEKDVMIWSPYLLSPTYLVSYTEKALKGISKLNVTGITVTDLGRKLVSDYNTKASVGRETTLGKVAEAVGLITESLDVVMKNPYQYAWEGITKMSDLPSRSTEYTIFNHEIPLLQLVLDGCVSYSTEPLNYQTQKSMDELLLKCIETRSNPKFYVMDADMGELYYMLYADYLSITYSSWADRIAALYQEYADFASQVMGSQISSHENLSDQVVKVGYDNGVTVYLNYGNSQTTVDGHQLAAQGYLIVK